MASLFGSKLWPKMRDGVTQLTEQYFNPIWDLIDRRLDALEGLKISWEAAVADLSRFGLRRIDESLAPAIDRIQELTRLGFLIGQTAGNDAPLVEGQDHLLFVVEEQRDLFTPTPWVAFVREDNRDDFAIVRQVSYDSETGAFVGNVIAIHGNAGPHDDWIIAANAGVWEAVIDLAAQVAEDKGIVAGDKSTVASDKGVAVSAKTDAVTAKNLAQAWAAKDEDSVVSGGLYSALHYAAKAAASASAAALFDPSNYYTKAQTYTQAEVASQISAAINALVAGAPGALDTLNELAAALGNDADFATTVTNALAAKADATTVTNALASKLEDVSYADILSAAIGSASEVRANTASKLLAVQPALASLDWVSLTDSSTIAFDMSAGVNRKVTLGGNRTLGQISNAIVGMTFAIEVSQPGSSSTRTLSYHSSYVTPEGGITIKTGNNQKTLLVGQVLEVSGSNASKAFIGMAGAGWTS